MVEKNSLRKKYSGFSVIELLVVVLIMVFVFTVGNAAFRDFARRKDLDSYANNLRSDLRLAQSFAIAAKKMCSNPNYPLEGYRILVESSDRRYSISAICVVNPAIPTKEYVNYKTITLPSHLTISTSIASPGNYLDFLILGRGVGIASGENITITITLSSTSESRQVVVYKTGEIR